MLTATYRKVIFQHKHFSGGFDSHQRHTGQRHRLLRDGPVRVLLERRVGHPLRAGRKTRQDLFMLSRTLSR
jgi:hypothetical protein